jgi:hypothetical protein
LLYQLSYLGESLILLEIRGADSRTNPTRHARANEPSEHRNPTFPFSAEAEREGYSHERPPLTFEAIALGR